LIREGRGVCRLPRSFLGAVLAPVVAAGLAAPVANADMPYGNYEVMSNRWTDAAWLWAAYPCEDIGPFDPVVEGCLLVHALPRPQRGAYYGGEARLVDGNYSFTTDVSDGLRCFGQVLPTRDTYTWNKDSLAGTVESRFDVGCFNGPPGMNVWTFALVRY
jgi:hypothetical protein